MPYRFELLYQTAASAQWSIHDAAAGGAVVGRIDLHFEFGRARATLVVDEGLPDEAVEDLVATIDEQLVPASSRGDVRISAWRGGRLGTFAPEA